jgi:hypothetical protein
MRYKAAKFAAKNSADTAFFSLFSLGYKKIYLDRSLFVLFLD